MDNTVMATVSIPEQNAVLRDSVEVKSYLAGLGIDYDQWRVFEAINESSSADEIMALYADPIAHVRQLGGYTKVDVVDVNPLTPGLDAMLSRFSQEHWHDEDEVRVTLHGRGVFHIHPPNGPVAAIEVGPGDMIRVPRGTHHWFDLCGNRTIKTIRFFQDPGGWTPHYTGTGAEQGFEPVCFGPAFIPRHTGHGL
jgi:1,2-dihydroxy-3-keto-5-methylthiopentene dioxygenase